MDFVEATRNQALLDVMEDGFLYNYRRICRWYSQRFNTPLYIVEGLPDEKVLQTFFECQFEDMSAEKRKDLALELTETPEELKARKKREDKVSDEAFVRRAAREAKKERKAREAKLKQTAKKVAEAEESEILGGKTPKAPKPPPLPEVSMRFDDGGNLMEEESIPVPPPRKR